MLTTSVQSDQLLVEAYRNGDNKAFDSLLRRHQQRLFTYIKHIVGCADTANDIFQETFIKVITTIRNGGYVDTGKFSAWLMRVAHNIIIDHFRHEKPNNFLSTDEEGSTVLNDPTLSDASFEEKLLHLELHEDVRSIIDELPQAQQEVLKMRFYQDFTFQEIADAMGTSINTALGRMRYALQNLRRLAQVKKIELFV